MRVVNSKFKLSLANPKFNDTEIWEFQNDSGGWFHPVHVHLIDVKILDRNGKPPFPHELGPKDVIYVGEGETVRVITKFNDGHGRYMIHCHNLVHEDHDMMNQYEVVDSQNPSDDPRGTLAIDNTDEGNHPL